MAPLVALCPSRDLARDTEQVRVLLSDRRGHQTRRIVVDCPKGPLSIHERLDTYDLAVDLCVIARTERPDIFTRDAEVCGVLLLEG